MPKATTDADLVTAGGISPDDFTNHIERIVEIAEHPLLVPPDLESRVEKETEHLLVSTDTLRGAATALCTGHLVLQGPPGTGKSSLANALCRAFGVEAFIATAHEGWSPYEVIGRQELKVDDVGKEEIIPVDGVFTEAVVRCANSMVANFDHPETPQATWLIIDEINRAHIDRAFGELFTVLGTDERIMVRLGHRPAGDRMLVVPSRFRIIATANTTDKQFVNNVSQALRRRFTFITVDIPEPRAKGEEWGGESSPAVREFDLVIDRAVERVVAQEESADPVKVRQLVEAAKGEIKGFFDLVETCRYSTGEQDVPYLPAGTAPLIDVIELYLTRVLRFKASPGEAIDWAASVKFAPLFDVDFVRPDVLRRFAGGLPSPFDRAMRRELLLIATSGASYVAR